MLIYCSEFSIIKFGSCLKLEVELLDFVLPLFKEN